MATVSLLPATAGTTAASDVNDALYSTETNSMRVINGHLEAANLAGALTTDHLKDNALVGGKAVAATGNLDCPAMAYAFNIEDAGALKAIPGASIEFFLPFDASLVIITWNIGAGNTCLDDATVDREVRMYIDGSNQQGFKRTLPAGRIGGLAVSGTLFPSQDFRYSGHKIITGMTKGFHSASLRLFVGEDMVRVRVRDMKVIWFK